MRVEQFYSYDNPEFAVLKGPIRDVMSAYGNAEKWFADIKDRVLIDFGMPFLSDYIHALEHVQPERVDEFAVVAHVYHLRLPYPATPELAEELGDDLDRMFEICVRIVDEIDEALNNFIHTAANGRFNALSLKAEDLQLENTYDREKLLQMWAMHDNGNMSRASLDSWIRRLYRNGECDDDED